MLNIIKNPLFSISDLKKSPSKLINKSKEFNDAVYILSNNKNVGVLLDSDIYEEFVNEKHELQSAIDKLQEELIYTQTELRLNTSQATLSDEEVRRSRANIDLSDIRDEWS